MLIGILISFAAVFSFPLSSDEPFIVPASSENGIFLPCQGDDTKACILEFASYL